MKINTIPNALKFTQICSRFPDVDVGIQQGKYYINGKSILALLSLDLTKTMLIDISPDSKEFLNKIKKFLY
jgi:phosphotransferase system HPr-like phosphotransfer protein